MLRVSAIRTSVERTVASATTGTASDGGCDNVDMGDGSYWLCVGDPASRDRTVWLPSPSSGCRAVISANPQLTAVFRTIETLGFFSRT